MPYMDYKSEQDKVIIAAAIEWYHGVKESMADMPELPHCEELAADTLFRAVKNKVENGDKFKRVS